MPLLAGGAALAGGSRWPRARGTSRRTARTASAAVSSKDLTKAAQKVGDVGAQVGEVALEVRRAREATNGNGKAHRSPIEVVLQGLTRGAHTAEEDPDARAGARVLLVCRARR